jgi:hypothetical protein
MPYGGGAPYSVRATLGSRSVGSGFCTFISIDAFAVEAVLFWNKLQLSFSAYMLVLRPFRALAVWVLAWFVVCVSTYPALPSLASRGI